VDVRDSISAVMLGSLDDAGGADELARRMYRSRSSFFRLFQALIEETPGAMRRRLLLERAAWQLGAARVPVTDIALEANYGSLEAFTRAFRKAFGVSPSVYRRMGCPRIHLPAPNEFHFLPRKSQLKGANNMDLFDLFAGADSWYTQRLLKEAASLTDEQLDRPINSSSRLFGWDKPDCNLRETLERLVQMKEIWTAALTGGDMPNIDSRPAAERTPGALLERFEKTDGEFRKIMQSVRDRGAWDETFVDALCEPAETFTFGGVFTHIITFNTWRRLAAMDSLHRLGVDIPDSGCPMGCEESIRGHAG